MCETNRRREIIAKITSGEISCPECGAVFMDKSTNYCGNCGQALDWSEK